MTDVFGLKSEVPAKEKIISQFSEWWSDDEIRERIIPNIVDKSLKDSISGALKNYSNTKELKRKRFTEILYDLVGQNFLVNQDKTIRRKFLSIILKKKFEEDSSFQTRFFASLIQRKTANSPGLCKKCNKRWIESDKIYFQTLGLDKEIFCCDDQCFSEQQKKSVPLFSDSKFIEFISKFDLRKDYIIFCKKLINEFDFPSEVILKPSRENKLLPETIRPLGKFSPLYDYQSSIGLKIVDMLENYAIDTSRALIVLPTGSGKTRLVVETLIDWMNNGKKGKENSKFILWVVDKNELCQQAFDTFANVFRHRGKKDSSLKLHPIYGENTKNIRDILYQYSYYSDEIPGEIHEENGIIIASIQSLYKICQNDDKGSLSELGKYTSMVVIDEAHHAIPSNKSYSSVLRALGFEFKNVRKQGADINKNHTCLLGLTATPFRGEDQLGKNTIALLNRFGKKHRILWPPFSDSTENENIPPYAHLEVQKTAFQNERIKLYGEGSHDRDGKIIEYYFTIQKLLTSTDNNTNPIISEISSEEKNIDFVFKDPGRYAIQLIVKDDQGKKSENRSATNIEVFPLEKQEPKTNVEEMKRLYKHLIKREILAKPHHYIIDNSKFRINIDRKKDIDQFKQFHDVSKSTIRQIGTDFHRNHLIIEKLVSLVKNEHRRSILLFACSIEHSKLISFILDAIYGIKSASIDHTVSTEERDEIIHDFRTRKISVLCNYDILTTGFDSPKVECVFVTRPTFSYLLYNQMTGRGLRGPRSNGTSDCIIIDISDNIQLGTDEGLIEQPWKIFDYIYETTYDEQLQETREQKCYSCFGLKYRKMGGKKQDCKICNGVGIISPKNQLYDENTVTENTVTENRKKFEKLQREIFNKHPDWTLKKIKIQAKKEMKYDEIFSSNQKPETLSEWKKICKKCNKKSLDMQQTIFLFGRSEDLITKDNPNGIFDECKKCRY